MNIATTSLRKAGGLSLYFVLLLAAFAPANAQNLSQLGEPFNASKFSRNELATIQSGLVLAGHSVGVSEGLGGELITKIDGIWGPNSQAALDEFTSKRGQDAARNVEVAILARSISKAVEREECLQRIHNFEGPADICPLGNPRQIRANDLFETMGWIGQSPAGRADRAFEYFKSIEISNGGLLRKNIDALESDLEHTCDSLWWASSEFSDIEAVLARTDLEHRCSMGLTVASLLHMAAAHGPPAAVAWLADRSNDLNETFYHVGTPLHIAAFEGKVNNVNVLLEHGANFEARTTDGYTPLATAIFGGSAESAAALPLAGARLGGRTVNGSSETHLAASSGSTKTLELVLAHGGDVLARNANGITPLHIAVKDANTEMIRSLLANGADLLAKSNNGDTPVHLAAEYGQRETLQAFLEDGDYDELRGGNGKYLIHFAAAGQDPESIRLLLSRGADVNATTDLGDTPLHVSAWQDSGGTDDGLEQMRILIEAGADVNAKANDGTTPLHFAIEWGANEQKIIALLEAGASPDIPNNEGQTAIDFFKEKYPDRVGSDIYWRLSDAAFVGLGDLAKSPRFRHTINRDLDGHFYMTLNIDGVPIRFLVDTGATITVIDRETAKLVGVDLSQVRFSSMAVTANGRVETALVEFGSIEFEESVDLGIVVSVANTDQRLALLGMNYLGLFDRLEILGDTLVLTRDRSAN